MVPFNLTLEANNLGRILELLLALVLVDLVLLLLDFLLLLELNPSPLLSLGNLCTLNILSSVDFP